MFSTKLSVFPKASPLVAAVCALAVVVVAGCSSTPAADKTATWSPNKIYAEAKDEAGSGAYDKAIPLYEKLEGRAAGTPLAQQAQLDKAYAQYKGGEQAQALATLNRFMKLHPASPAMDYALYLTWEFLVSFHARICRSATKMQQKNRLNPSRNWLLVSRTLAMRPIHACA